MDKLLTQLASHNDLNADIFVLESGAIAIGLINSLTDQTMVIATGSTVMDCLEQLVKKNKGVNMPLHLDKRPNSLDAFLGNEGIKDSLRSVLSRKQDIPHTFLFSGPSGCGKTTLARIAANMVGCHETSIIEYNSSNTRGIDTIREISQNAQMSAMIGKNKAYIIDECFAEGTLISTPDGPKNIEKIASGDSVFSIQGETKVRHIFKNQIPLHRIVKVTFTDGTYLHTTKQHLFLTNSGWKECQNLTKNDLLLNFNCNIVNDIRLQLKEIVNENTKTMSQLWNNDGLLPEQAGKIQSTNLFPCMFSNSQNTEAPLGRNETETIYFQKEIIDGHRNGSFAEEDALRENEEKQSLEGSNCSRKDKNFQKNEWDLRSLEEQSWGEWQGTNSPPACSSNCNRLGNGSCSSNKRQTEWFSKLLQTGYRKSEIESGNRSQWYFPYIERYYSERCQEKGETGITRVENIEFYQRGNNDGSFQSVVSNKEINQGYVEFYDLEIEGHPSYFANGLTVHNCHKLTNDAMNALLKILEDTPSHVYFFLATTDPDKLIKAIRTRCMTFEVKKLASPVLTKLIKETVKSEGIDDFPDSVVNAIVKVADGCPRQALIILDSVIDIVDEDAALKAVAEANLSETSSLDLCRLLISDTKNKWPEARELLQGLPDDAEGIRYGIMGYMTKIILNEKSGSDITEKAVLINDCFMESLMYTKMPGLINAVYYACKV